jgi:hypothetical protein
MSKLKLPLKFNLTFNFTKASGFALAALATVAIPILPSLAATGTTAPSTTAASSLAGTSPGDANTSGASTTGNLPEADNAVNSASPTGRSVSDRPNNLDSLPAIWWWLLPLLPLGVIAVWAISRQRLDQAQTSPPPSWGHLPPSTVPDDDAAGFALGTPHRHLIQPKTLDPAAQTPPWMASTGLNPVAPLPASNGNLGGSTFASPMSPEPSLSSRSQPISAQESSQETSLEPILEPAHLTMAGVSMAGQSNDNDDPETWITLTPLNSHQGEVNWQLSEAHRLQAKRQGGQQMMIRIHDADPASQPEPWPTGSYSYECRASMDRKLVDLPAADRDYVAEVGFLTAEEDWISIARSFHSHSPTAEYDGRRVVIMPCDPHRQMREGPTRHPKPQAYVYWDIAPEFKRRLRRQGGQMLALRVYDADQINLDQQKPHHTDEYVIDENARDRVVTVPRGDRDYVAEIGYLTLEGQFLSLGRSLHAKIPAMVHQRANQR